MQRSILAAVAVGCLASASALAQSASDQRPSHTDIPAREVQQRQDPNAGVGAKEPKKLEPAAYLGIATSPAPQAVRQQLGFPQGFGLMVDAVAPDSPAAEAGLRASDVLQKINDQLLVNPQQLAALVRSYKPNEAVKLTLFRQGKLAEISVKLVERDLPPLDHLRFDAPAVPPAGAMGHFQLELDPASGIPRLVNRRPGEEASLFAEQFTIVMDDGNLVLQLSGQGGKQLLVARDKSGKELFNGPIDTQEQRQAVPPAIREKLPQISRLTTGGRIDTPSGARPPSTSEAKNPATRPVRVENHTGGNPSVESQQP